MIQVAGPAGIAGFGMLLFLQSIEFKKNQDEHMVKRIITMTAGPGVLLLLTGGWWLIIIITYFPRFFFWPIYWIMSLILAVLSLIIGIFAILIINNRKKINCHPKTKNTQIPTILEF